MARGRAAGSFRWDNFLRVYYPIGPGISARAQVIALYRKITISITAAAEAADGGGVHPSPAFLLSPAPAAHIHIYTVSPGIRAEAEMTGIIHFYSPKTKKEDLLFFL